jgi:hypothetical protein
VQFSLFNLQVSFFNLIERFDKALNGYGKVDIHNPYGRPPFFRKAPQKNIFSMEKKRE